MTEQFENLGYLGFFLASFLAATLVPLSSEVIAAVMVTRGFTPTGLVIAGTLGGYLGSLVNYYMAKYGSKLAFSRFFRVDPERLKRVQGAYAKWGSPLLFFSWLPVLGETITVAGGVLCIPLPIFSFWVLFGRAARYIILLWAVTQSIRP
jgi:membrane protein YqaA with SNARE-associated domain